MLLSSVKQSRHIWISYFFGYKICSKCLSLLHCVHFMLILMEVLQVSEARYGGQGGEGLRQKILFAIYADAWHPGGYMQVIPD
jgi:hypothetical protein